jgi:Domain of unknown function (DUF4189)
VNIAKPAYMALTLTGLALLLALSGSLDAVKAQSCGAGYRQEGGAEIIHCVPLEQPPTPSEPSSTGPLWETRWGAIAVDSIAGKFGGAERMTNKREAEKAAKNICKANGGTKCKTVIAYHDQCGILAWGDARYTSFSGPELDATAQRAIAACSEFTNNCQVYYSGCSYPEQVR